MKVQEVICRVLAGTLTWLQGADILGIHTRSLRRWRARYERDGVLGLHDGRRGQPSRRKAPIAEVQRILRLYRERYGPRDGHPGFLHPHRRRQGGSHPSHAARPRPHAPRDRAHPQLLPPGPRPRRAAQPHPARPAHQRAPRGGHHPRWRRPTPTCASTSSPTTTPSSLARRRTRTRPSWRSGPSTWISSCARRKSAPSASTMSSSSHEQPR